MQITDLHALIGISLWCYSTHISISIVQIVYGGDFQATRAMIITWLDATTWSCSSNVRFHYLIGIKLVTWHILYHCAVFSGEKTPRACWAVWLSLMVHRGHPRNRPKSGHISSKTCTLKHFSDYLYQLIIQTALEELCLQYYSRNSAINIALGWLKTYFKSKNSFFLGQFCDNPQEWPLSWSILSSTLSI